ncbi:hypothetical protein BDR07DRAFT_1492528 [Suillus spraguei]|nr:hypothetical protein BDR07DRAFT_1492528 [Suillus spraguei]
MNWIRYGHISIWTWIGLDKRTGSEAWIDMMSMDQMSDGLWVGLDVWIGCPDAYGLNWIWTEMLYIYDIDPHYYIRNGGEQDAPEWMHDKKAVEEYKADFKVQLTQAGLIHSQPKSSILQASSAGPSSAPASSSSVFTSQHDCFKDTQVLQHLLKSMIWEYHIHQPIE